MVISLMKRGIRCAASQSGLPLTWVRSWLPPVPVLHDAVSLEAQEGTDARSIPKLSDLVAAHLAVGLVREQ